MSRYLGKYRILRNIDVDESGDVGVAHGCMLFGIIASNVDSQTIHYLKLYNQAAAADENDTPVVTIPLPAAYILPAEFEGGIEFIAGIAMRATTGVADDDTGAPGDNEIVVNLLYK